jgi:hypothetical protein
LSVYALKLPVLDTLRGAYSLLSPDGKAIALSVDPIHVSGPDVLQRIRLLKVERGEHVFFDGDDAYVDKEQVVDVYQFDNGWQKLRSITKPAEFYVNEVSRCGASRVISLSDDDSLRLIDPDGSSKSSGDWLAGVGLRRLVRRYSDQLAVGGVYGRCVVPLVLRGDPQRRVVGIARFDDHSMDRFDLKSPMTLSPSSRVHLSKDGCLALFTALYLRSEKPQPAPIQAVVLKLVGSGCA